MIQAVYDQELANVGRRRIHVSEVVEVHGKLATVVREKVVKLSDVKPNPEKPWWKAKVKKGKARMNVDQEVIKDVESAVKNMVADRITSEKKAPRSNSKLSQAVEIVKSTGKDDKESCLQAIVNALGVKRGNATIYYAKAKAILG